MKNINKGQAAILIIFVIGMVGLLIGMTLSKTGFSESMMGRGTAGSTYAFYVANSGIEDALYKIQKAEDEELDTIPQYTLKVGSGNAKITISERVISKDDTLERIQRDITSIGTYENYLRRIRVSAYIDILKPEFTRIIQAGVGGIEIERNVKISGRYKDGADADVSIYSNSFVRGWNNGNNNQSNCDSPSATSQIKGNVYAVESIDKLDNGYGPCVDGDVFAGKINECRIYGYYYYEEGNISPASCPHDTSKWCNPTDDPEKCRKPEIIDLPDIQSELIESYLKNTHTGDCTIGNINDKGSCYVSNDDGSVTIGNIIITGNLITNSNSTMYISGPIIVYENITFDSNQTISLHPSVVDKTSLIMIAKGKVIANSNTKFTSEDNSFLLLVSLYKNDIKEKDGLKYICEGKDNIDAISISANVKSILFYATDGCAYVKSSANEEYFGAIIGLGVKIDQNVALVYDPALENAEFYLTQDGGWQISSFTEY